MIADDKAIYFIHGDMDIPALPEIPQTDDAKRTLLQAFIVLFKDFLPEGDELGSFLKGSAETVVEESVKHYSDDVLRSLAGKIEQGLRDSPERAAEWAKVNSYETIALKWRQIAVASGSPDATLVAMYCNAVVEQQQGAAQTLLSAEVSANGTLRALKILGLGTGSIFTALEYAGAVQQGATDPKGALTNLAGIAVGGAVGGWMLSALGGVAAFIGAPVLAVAGWGLAVLAAGYAAGKIGEYIWDEFISDNLWQALDSVGWKEPVEKFISNVGELVSV